MQRAVRKQYQTSVLNQAGDMLPILSCQGVLNCFDKQPLLFKPGAGAAMEHRNGFGAPSIAQTRPYNVSKELVIAIPMTVVVQRDDEEIRAFQLVEDKLAVCRGA